MKDYFNNGIPDDPFLIIIRLLVILAGVGIITTSVLIGLGFMKLLELLA